MNKAGQLTLERVSSPDLLIRAWRRIRANAGMPGVDGERIAEFEAGLDQNLADLGRALRSGHYRPQPVRRIWRPKSDGRLRPIAILTLRDRIAQRAVHDALAPIFEQRFLPCSLGYRPGLGIPDAVTRIGQARDRGLHWVVDGDITDCFGQLDHQVLLSLVAREVQDRGVLGLIQAWLNAEILNDLSPTTHRQPAKGTTQGGALSPLLCNIYLHEFDRGIGQAGLELTRYADDWVILCADEARARRAGRTAADELGKLGLAVNPHKTAITHFARGFCFLGVFFLRGEHFYLAPGAGEKRAAEPVEAGNVNLLRA